MGRIFGENFYKYVDDQIDVRQKFNASTSKFKGNYTLDARQAFTRLISGVNINDQNILNRLGLNKGAVGQGSDLAKKFILFNGISNVNNVETNQIRSSKGLSLNTAFPKLGWGGIEEGYKPQPFIETINITSKNNGSLRESTVKIKAYNSIQFKVIELLFLKLGYSMLLEWGWVDFLNNNSTHDRFDNYSDTSPKFQFLKSGKDITTINKLIQDQRKKCSGNYDGFIGTVTNYEWQINPDATYEISIDLITYGDVIESLNMNIPSSNSYTIKKKEDIDEEQLQDEEITLENLITENSIGSYFYRIIEKYNASQPIPTKYKKDEYYLNNTKS